MLKMRTNISFPSVTFLTFSTTLAEHTTVRFVFQTWLDGKLYRHSEQYNCHDQVLTFDTFSSYVPTQYCKSLA